MTPDKKIMIFLTLFVVLLLVIGVAIYLSVYKILKMKAIEIKDDLEKDFMRVDVNELQVEMKEVKSVLSEKFGTEFVTELKHQNLVLKAGAVMNIKSSVLEIGKLLYEADADTITDCGFWVWDYVTDDFYSSPKFKHCLGYENDNDFPPIGDSFKKAMTAETLHSSILNVEEKIKERTNDLFYNEVVYTTKSGSLIRFICSVTIIYRNGEPAIMVGTHKNYPDAR
jgi:hypothetical protein